MFILNPFVPESRSLSGTKQKHHLPVAVEMQIVDGEENNLNSTKTMLIPYHPSPAP
jgi:hypothetical protein